MRMAETQPSPEPLQQKPLIWTSLFVKGCLHRFLHIRLLLSQLEKEQKSVKELSGPLCFLVFLPPMPSYFLSYLWPGAAAALLLVYFFFHVSLRRALTSLPRPPDSQERLLLRPRRPGSSDGTTCTQDNYLSPLCSSEPRVCRWSFSRRWGCPQVTQMQQDNEGSELTCSSQYALVHRLTGQFWAVN